MLIHIISDSADRIRFSNEDEIYECMGGKEGIWKGKWGLDKKERREKREEYYKNGGTGAYVDSWLLNSFSKKEALMEYQVLTKNILI